MSAWAPVMMIRKIVWLVRLFSMPSVGPKAPKKKVQVPTLMAPSTVIEAEQVEPGRQPAGEAVAEDRAPVIEAARRRIGRADLRHAPARTRREMKQPSGQPMPMPMPPAPEVAWRQRIDAAGQDADDREGNCEVREAAHAPLQFLRIAHAVEDLDVLLLVDFRVPLHPCAGYAFFARCHVAPLCD